MYFRPLQNKQDKKSSFIDDLLSRLPICTSLEEAKTIGFIFLLFFISSRSGDIYFDHWAYIGWALCLRLFFYLRTRFSFSLAVYLPYLVGISIWQVWTDGGLSIKIETLVENSILRHILLIILSFYISSKLKLEPFKKALTLAGPICCIFLLYGYQILENQSTNGALIISLFSFHNYFFAYFLFIIALFKQPGSTAYLVMFSQFFSRLIYYPNYRRYIIGGLGIVIGMLGIIYNDKMVLYSDRFFCYKMAWDLLPVYSNFYIGSGVGTFEVLGPMMQKSLGQDLARTGAWAAAHSDYVQVFYEQGLIGFLLFSSMILQAIYKADYEIKLFLISFCVFASFYFPMEIPLVAFLVYASVTLTLQNQAPLE